MRLCVLLLFLKYMQVCIYTCERLVFFYRKTEHNHRLIHVGYTQVWVLRERGKELCNITFKYDLSQSRGRALCAPARLEQYF